MEVITGTARVDQLNQAQLVIDMEPNAHKLYQDAYAFEALTRNVRGGMGKATRMQHLYREDRLMPNTTVTTAAAAAAATSIAVSVANIGFRDMNIYCPATGEMFSMDEDIGGTAVAGAIKVRGLASATGTGITTAIPAGSVLVFVTEAHAEGEAVPPAFITKETDAYTYLMQFDEVIEFTDIFKAEKKYGEDDINKQRAKKWIEVKKKLNLYLYAGQQVREVASAGGARRHSLRGLISYLASRDIDASAIPGGLTRATLGLFLRPTTQYGVGMDNKVLMAGQNAWAAISSYPDSALRTPPGDGIKWGVTVKQLITAFGTLDCVYDQMLSQEYGLADRLFIVDPNRIKQLEMEGLPLVIKTGIQNPTEIHIETRDVITGTRGLEVPLAEVHQSVSGIN